MTTATRPRLGVSMPMLNQPAARYPQLAALADDAGFDSIWDYEFYRNPFITHTLCAQASTTIQLGTGIATTAGRSPFEMANAAADVDEISGGRAIVGLSTGGGGWTDVFNGADISHPLPRMREYIQAMRAIWKHFSDDEPFHYDGTYVQAASPMINPWGTRDLVRPRIPIYLGGIKEKMLRMAGELADGVIGYLYTPSFIAEHVIPNVAKGAAQAGRDPAEVDIAALVLCSISEDRDEAIRRARISVGSYVAFPVSNTVIEFMGLQEDRDHVVARLLAEGPQALETAVSDELVRHFCITGTPDEAREQLAEYQAVLRHVVLHTPYVPPINTEESNAAFRNIISTFGR